MLATALSTGFSEKDNLHSGDDTTLYCMNEVGGCVEGGA